MCHVTSHHYLGSDDKRFEPSCCHNFRRGVLGMITDGITKVVCTQGVETCNICCIAGVLSSCVCFLPLASYGFLEYMWVASVLPRAAGTLPCDHISIHVTYIPTITKTQNPYHHHHFHMLLVDNETKYKDT